MGRWAEELLAELDGLKEWPPREHAEALRRVSRGIALRDRDKETLRVMAGWHEGRRAEAFFVTDPLPSRISSAFSSLIFGREPEFTAANPADQDRLDDLVTENNFRSELQRAARTASSEGEVWWRIFIDRDITPWPLLEWHSRTSVYPLWGPGSRLLAVAFISRLKDLQTRDGKRAYRHFEIHEVDPEVRGRVENVLYEEPVSTVETTQSTGSSQKRQLGERVDLDAHPETEHLAEEWVHGLPGMLAGRVANLVSADPKIGVSDYHDVEDWLIELNVAASIGHSNLELTGRKRVLVPEEEVNPETGKIDVGEQVLVMDQVEKDLGGGTAQSGSVYKVLEHSFDAEALVVWIERCEKTACTRIGLDLQYTGVESAQGQAESGVALRIKLIPSQGAGDERAQDWDQQLPIALLRMQQLDAAPDGTPPPEGEGEEEPEPLELVEGGGFARPWLEPEEPPSIDRGATLPEDPVEGTDRRATATSERFMSRWRAIELENPDWDETQVRAEWDRTFEEEKRSSDITGGGFGASFPPSEDDPGGFSEEEEPGDDGAEDFTQEP